jgi:hypothetical protein
VRSSLSKEPEAEGRPTEPEDEELGQETRRTRGLRRALRRSCPQLLRAPPELFEPLAVVLLAPLTAASRPRPVFCTEGAPHRGQLARDGASQQKV